MLEWALQASIGSGLGAEVSGGQRPLVPFAVEEVEVLRAVPGTAVAVVRRREGAGGEGATAKVDVSVVEAGTGRECVRVRGLTSRVLGAYPGAEAAETLFLVPRWQVHEPEAGVVP